MASRRAPATTVVRDREQGLIVPARDIDALCEAMKLMAEDGDLNRRLGCAAREAGARDLVLCDTNRGPLTTDGAGPSGRATRTLPPAGIATPEIICGTYPSASTSTS